MFLPDIDNNKLIEYAYKLKDSQPSGVSISNVLGWQSENLNQTIFDSYDLEITRLFNYIQQNLITSKKELNLKLNLSLSFGNVWININPKNAYNQPQNHPNSILSGVYYVACKEGSGKVVFKNPASNMLYHLSNRAINEYNNVNCSVVQFNPVPGLLLIFPSWIEHYVMPNLNEEDRISIAFNVTMSE